MALYYVSGKDGGSRLLHQAFELTEEEGIESKWMYDTSFVEELSKDDFVVVDEFQGDVFSHLEKQSKHQRYKIVGPLCVTSCLKLNKALPKLLRPVHNITLIGVVACCTSVAKEDRNKLLDLIALMGGKVSKDFTSDVTHLVAGEVGSQKYSVATHLNKPILLPEWVNTCWEKGSKEYFCGTDKDIITEHRCPIFKGCTISVSGLSDRQHIKMLVEENGGSYSPELNMRTCTHLLVKAPQGEKFEYAKQWKIHCVHPDWFYKCINAGHWMEEASFLIDKEESRQCTNALQNVSSVNCTVTAGTSLLQSRLPSEGELSRVSIQGRTSKAAEVAEKLKKSRESCSTNEQSSFLVKTDTEVDRISIIDPCACETDEPLSKLKTVSHFLDGCRIYLDGFQKEKMDYLRKVINAGGATRYNKLNDNVTHVVLGELTSPNTKKALLSFDPLPVIVGGNWLMDSFKNDKCMSEEVYSLIEFHQKNEDGKDNRKEDRETKKETSKNDSVFEADINMDDDEDDDVILQQYLGGQENRSSKDLQIEPSTRDDTRDDGEHERRLLTNLKFRIERFRAEETTEIQQLIEDNGGSVPKSAAADYIIVPITYYSKDYQRQENEVTICWLEQSLEEDRLLDQGEKFIFHPFYLSPDQKPLTRCVVSVSQFTGIEREHVLDLCSLLGACVQDYFVRTDNGNLKASTHLILKEPSGNKYEAAVKWDIPAVGDKWLYACAESSKLIPVDRYLIDCIDQEPSLVIPNNSSVVGGLEDQRFCDRDVAEEMEDGENHTVPDLEVLAPNVNAMKSQVPMENQASDSGRKMSAKSATKTKTPLKVSKSFRPSFDFSEAIDAVTSPPVSLSQRRKSRASRGSFPFDNLFDQHIQKGVQRTQGAGNECNDGFNLSQRKTNEIEEKENREIKVLHGVIIAVSKKLARRQTELHNLAASLGAESRFIFDDSCTHFIHEGKINDTSRDFLQAKAEKKFIVSPTWLEDCVEQQKWLQENLYPHAYNPRYSLNVVCSTKKSSDPKVQKSNNIIKTKEAFEPDASRTEKENDIQTLHYKKDDTLPMQEAPRSVNTSLSKQEEASALEERLDLQKKLEEVMEATKAINGGLRRSKRHRHVSTTSGDDPSTSRASLSKRRRRQSSQKSSGDSSRSSENGGNVLDGKGDENQEVEPSQGDVISYDDPAGRQERERILAQFKMTGCSQDPESSGKLPQTTTGVMEESRKGVTLHNINEEGTDTTVSLLVDKSEGEDTSDRVKTANPSVPGLSHPPINLPITKKVEAPTPINLLDEDDDKEKIQPSQATVHYFLLSSITPQEKADYSALIEQLGGKVFESYHYNPQCTHVVVGTPNRNEKFLASVAAGKWILHTSYLEASREAGYFVKEDEHEWGSESDVSKLASAAKRWRIKLAEERKERETLGAFEGWKVYLCVDKSRQPGFKRLLEAGGALVTAVRPPFPVDVGVTHVFVDLSKAKTNLVNVQEIFQAGIPVLKPEYIAEYLTQDPSPLVEKFLLPELQQLTESEADGRHDSSRTKRKCEDDSSQQSKRSKQ